MLNNWRHVEFYKKDCHPEFISGSHKLSINHALQPILWDADPSSTDGMTVVVKIDFPTV